MKNRAILSVPAFILLPLAGCASLPPLDTPRSPPAAFHDTRLQYALLTGDDAALARDFGMKLPPSWAERIVAGTVLPLTAATEAAFYPFATGIDVLAPRQQPKASSP